MLIFLSRISNRILHFFMFSLWNCRYTTRMIIVHLYGGNNNNQDGRRKSCRVCVCVWYVRIEPHKWYWLLSRRSSLSSLSTRTALSIIVVVVGLVACAALIHETNTTMRSWFIKCFGKQELYNAISNNNISLYLLFAFFFYYYFHLVNCCFSSFFFLLLLLLLVLWIFVWFSWLLMVNDGGGDAQRAHIFTDVMSRTLLRLLFYKYSVFYCLFNSNKWMKTNITAPVRINNCEL